jgi:long-chain acyl-CoA synthetase
MSRRVLLPSFVPDTNVALRGADGRQVTYGNLRTRAHALERALRPSARSLALCLLPRTLDAVGAYIGAMEAGLAVLPMDVRAPADLQGMLHWLKPDFVIAPASAAGIDPAGLPPYRLKTNLEPLGASIFERADAATAQCELHPKLALILRTSGSIGLPKLVRLSYRNVESNANDIARSMNLMADDCGATTAPLDFAGGLSVLHSHLAAGASLLVSSHGVIATTFWKLAAQNGVTNIYLVPMSCRLLQGAKWRPENTPRLRLVCQAAGPLDAATARHFIQLMSHAGGGFATMYGQTEATARMTYLDPDSHAEHPGSVGRPIGAGSLEIAGTHSDDKVETAGEVIYRGPNVMMGYAHGRADLALGDVQRGMLSTGDIGFLARGHLYLKGRTDRMVKLSGKRIHLEDVEAYVERAGCDTAVTSLGDRIFLHSTSPMADLVATRRDLCMKLDVPPDVVVLRQVEQLPRTRSGKIDYGSLKETLT